MKLTETDQNVGGGKHNNDSGQEPAPAEPVAENIGALSTVGTVDMATLADQLWSQAVVPSILRDGSL